MQRVTNIIFAAAMTFCVASTAPARVAATVPAATAAAQCKRADRPIQKQIKFQAGRTSAVIKDTVRLCTSHEYSFRAKAGQRVTLHLATGRHTSMTLFPPGADALLDGGTDWEGELPSTGTYVLAVATDRTAQYTLEITIR